MSDSNSVCNQTAEIRWTHARACPFGGSHMFALSNICECTLGSTLDERCYRCGPLVLAVFRASCFGWQ
eukprot:6172742-Pleurochrysis_carterae.AAC.1